MVGFYLSFLAVLFSGLAARDQLTVAGLTFRQGQRLGVFLTAVVVTVGTSTLAAWAAMLIAPILAAEARLFMAALALAFAGGESLILAPRVKAREPTHSLGALAIVLSAQQLTDAARFLIFGIAVATHAPVPAALGGAIGGLLLIAAGWALPEAVAEPRMRLFRRLIGAVLLLVALYVGLNALGRV